MRVAAGRLATSPEEAVTAAHAVGFPVALKVVSPTIQDAASLGAR